jgi:hypothetical protein
VSEYDAQWKLSDAMMELALGEGTLGERLDRAAPLVMSLEAEDLPPGLRYRFIELREALTSGDHLTSHERCLAMAECLRDLEGAVNPFEDQVK